MNIREAKVELRKVEKAITKFKKEKDRILNPLYKERNRIEEFVNNESGRKLIGSCYRFPNSYGSGDKWFGYLKIIGVKEGQIVVLQIQKTCYNDIEIKTDTKFFEYFNDAEYYTSITPETFENHMKNFLKEIGYGS